MTESLDSHSPQRRTLVREMQRINFGHIRDLSVEDGEPVFTGSTRSVLNLKFGAENGARCESKVEDFTLKKKVRELFDAFDQLKNATIHNLEIKNGLPFSMQVEEEIA